MENAGVQAMVARGFKPNVDDAMPQRDMTRVPLEPLAITNENSPANAPSVTPSDAGGPKPLVQQLTQKERDAKRKAEAAARALAGLDAEEEADADEEEDDEMPQGGQLDGGDDARPRKAPTAKERRAVVAAAKAEEKKKAKEAIEAAKAAAKKKKEEEKAAGAARGASGKRKRVTHRSPPRRIARVTRHVTRV